MGATTATIGRVARPRQMLTDAQRKRIARATTDAADATARKRAVIVAVLSEGASFAEVSRETGLSTNTLQRWKREQRQ